MSSSDLKPIILYDIPCIIPGRPWSPNTMKTRYCLGYKRLPFTTVWVEFPDIAGLLQSKGIAQPPYTLPAIEDPNTGTVIMDSLAIATYLDETYPEKPKLLTPMARAMLERVGDTFSFGSRGGAGAGVQGDAGGQTSSESDLAPRLVFLVLASERLNPVSKAYYHETRRRQLGKQWSMVVDACFASPEDRAERVRQGIEAVKGTWHKLTVLYDRQPGDSTEGGPGTSSGGPFALGGEEPCFVDFAIAGRVKFMLDTLTSDPSEAEIVRNLEGGRLMKLVEDLERYYEC